MAFFNSAVDVLQTLVVALGAGLGIWGVINLMEGYGNDNRATRSCEVLGAQSRRAIVARNFGRTDIPMGEMRG
ncbi:MAG: Maff2 family mobile element protein [Parabacteroides distasonis]